MKARLELLKTAPRPLEMQVKRNADLTLNLLAQGVDPRSLPAGTLPKNFAGKKSPLKELDGGEKE